MWLRLFNLSLCQQSTPSKVWGTCFACTSRDSWAAWSCGAEVEEDYVSAAADLYVLQGLLQIS